MKPTELLLSSSSLDEADGISSSLNEADLRQSVSWIRRIISRREGWEVDGGLESVAAMSGGSHGCGHAATDSHVELYVN
jgi:hypothetical protein